MLKERCCIGGVVRCPGWCVAPGTSVSSYSLAQVAMLASKSKTRILACLSTSNHHEGLYAQSVSGDDTKEENEKDEVVRGRRRTQHALFHELND